MTNFERKIRILLVLLIAAINVVTFGIVAVNRDTYQHNLVDTAGNIESVDVEMEREGVVRVEGTHREGRYYVIDFGALGKGETQVTMTVHDRRGSEEDYTFTRQFRVNRLGMVVMDRGMPDFTGWHILWMGFVLSVLLIALMLLISFIRGLKTDLYSYRTSQIGGVMFFLMGLSMMNLVVSPLLVPRYRLYTLDSLWTYIFIAFSLFMIAALPFVTVFGVALSVSNIQLIRKEGFRVANALGIAISVMLLAGIGVLVVVAPTMVMMTSGSVHTILTRVNYVVSALFCFFLSFLLSTMVAGLVAAKRIPTMNADYIVILGCGIRRDGTLKPLLRGRVDRAIWFWRTQLALTGKRAVLMPSGGKGSDEIISEGEAMKRYLLEQGIPEECILPETKSATTYENMKFSKAMIREREGDGTEVNVVFSTTNYHVFRSGSLAASAGLKAQGIGSRTRWYFWPNAFVREFVGLLYSARKFEAAFFGVAALLFALFSLSI